MESLARRREIRKRRILQNSNDRLKKVISNNRANKFSDHTLDSGKHTVTNNHSEGYHKAFDESILFEQVPKQDQCGKEDLNNETDTRAIHETYSHDHDIPSSLDEIHEEKETETDYSLITSEAATVTITRLKRTLIVVICAIFCFYQSTFWALVTQVTGLLNESEVPGKQSGIILTLFCPMELMFLVIPSATMVNPGGKVNLWLLALKLCGVSARFLEKIQFVLLLALGFMTDLTVFLFVLIVLQNITAIL